MKIAFAGLRHDHVFVLYRMAQQHPGFEFCGAWEENPEAREYAEQVGIRCTYRSLNDLLQDQQVETVVLGGCYGDRGAIAIQGLASGKHVLADKPLCTSVTELERIEKLAQSSGKFVSCMFTMRFERKIQAVRELIQSGALGVIHNVTFGGQHPLRYGRRPQWYFERGKHGGVINDIAIHGIDAINYISGITVECILAARCWNAYAVNEPTFKDCAQFMLEGSNDVGILADVSYAIPDGIEFDYPDYWHFEFWGSKGVIRFSLNEDQSFYYLAGTTEAQLLEEDATVDYLTDFLNMVNGSDDVILPMKDVFLATRQTLEIQNYADQSGRDDVFLT